METDPKKNTTLDSEEKTSKQEEYYKVIKPIRTYERDLADHVRGTNASKTEVNLKEQKRKRERAKKEPDQKEKEVKESSNFKLRNVIAIIFVIFIFISVGGLVFSVFGPKEKVETVNDEVNTKIESFLTADQERNLNISGLNKESLALLLEETVGKEEVAIKKITLLNLIDSNQNSEIKPREFLEKIETRAPTSLLRSLGDEIDYGIFALLRFSGFLILEISDFANAYAGMLKWEENIADDLKGWVSNEFPDKKTFSDLTYKDRDLRILKDSRGEIVILYSFIDKKTLLITDKLETFEEIINRIK